MSQTDKSNILMLCGALHDIAEKTKEPYTKLQLEVIQYKIEKIVVRNLPKELKKEL